MPLLRQTLYAQNINLYLAPTADGRDAWLSLMRTVGIEGRCFVVSSNMCVPEDHSTESQAVGEDVRDAQPYEERSQRARRNSAITEEGFEIALPPQGAGSSGSGSNGNRPRRKSVLDENGNEIVLCCGAETVGTTVEFNNIPADGKAINGTSHGKKTFISRGGSCITDPFGEVLAGPQWEDDEGIVYADVDFKDCIRGRLDLDAAGSYSR